MCVLGHVGAGWDFLSCLLPSEDEKGEECELGAQSRNDSGEQAQLSPVVAAVLVRLVPWGFSPERVLEGGGGAG